MQASLSTKRRKRRQVWYVLVLITAVLVGYALINFWQQHQEDKNRFVHYPGFNIDVPRGYTIHGIDVSRHQGSIFWPSVKAMHVKDIQLDFTFIKATEGLTRVDPLYKRNWQKTREIGIPHGAYHFYIATKSGAAQAKNFINTVTLQTGDLPPVVDVEQLYGANPETMRAELKLWLEMVELHYNVKPIIYSYVNFYENYLGSDFDGYPLWIAHYLQKEKPRINRDWLFWQFNEAGKVNGVTSNTDFNVFNGDSTEFSQLLIP